MSELYEEHNNTDQAPFEPLWSCYSNESDESYIIETTCERLGLKKDKEDKVIVTWRPRERGKSSRFSRTKCAVRPDEDGLADMVFTAQVEKKLLKRLDDEELSEDTDTEIEKSEESRKYRDKNAGNADGFDSGYNSVPPEGERVSLLFQCFSTVDLLVQRTPALSQPAQPLASGSKRRTARIDDVSKYDYISAFFNGSESWKPSMMALGVHYSGQLDEDCIRKSVFNRLGLEKGKDGKVLIPWAPRSGGKTQLSNFTIRPDSEMTADVEIMSKALKGKEEIEKEKHVRMSTMSSGTVLQ